MFSNTHELFFGWGFMWIFWILLIIVVAVVIRSIATGASRSDSAASETPMEILKKRLARGEIDEQEYDKKRKILNS